MLLIPTFGWCYVTAQSKRMKGLNILDFYTEAQSPRLVGPIHVESKCFRKLLVLKTMVVEHIISMNR
jgi:CobQ-like glutamine amidotransferase family enzyme